RPAAGPPGRARPGRADHADDPLCVEFAGATRAQPRRSKYSPSFSVASEAEDTVRKEHTIEPVLPESGANISGVCGLRLAEITPPRTIMVRREEAVWRTDAQTRRAGFSSNWKPMLCWHC